MTNPVDAPVRTAQSCTALPPIPEPHLVSPLEGHLISHRELPGLHYRWASSLLVRLCGGGQPYRRAVEGPIPCTPLAQLYPDARGVNAEQGWCVE